MLHPRITEIQLICQASSSAAAFPGGEAFRFEFSPKGTHLLALSSSRIFVLDLSAEEVCVKRELKISRRPVAAAIVEDGSVLAVLSSNHTVTLYDLTKEKAQFMRSIPLENAPRTIALSPGAEVLGAAYHGGIEVYSLLPGALPTDRRAVNCDTVDTLAFSADGEVLVGTTLNCKTPTTVMVSAQHFSMDLPVEGLAQLWTTQVLFPRSSRDSSHASLLPEDQDVDENTWTITYDRVWQMFRAVRVDDLRNGHTYFTGPRDSRTGSAIPPTTLPAPAGDGRMVAAGFGEKVWIYGIPSTLEPPPEDRSQDGNASSGTPSRSNSTSGRATNWVSGQLGTVAMPQWQVLSDNNRNVNIGGREIGELSSLSGLKFVRCKNGTERLVTVAGGGVDSMLGEGGEEEFVAIGGGRVILYDFGRTPHKSSTTTVNIEIGDGIQGPVETLEEQHNDIEVEVDIVRRRTVAQKKNTDRQQNMQPHHRSSPGSSSSANNSFIPSIPRIPANMQTPAPPRTGPSMMSPRRQRTFDEDDETSGEAIDLPYSQGEPRSRTTLSRAATAARHVPQQANSSRYLRVVGPDGRPIPQNHPIQETRNEDGTLWVPPPPPYTPRDDEAPPLPQHLLATLQGPSRVREPYVSNNPSPGPSPSIRSMTTIQRTRTTLGSTMDNIMRRPSVFRPAVNTSSTNLGVYPAHHGNPINQSRSAPVSPAVGAPPPIFTGPRTGPVQETAYAANQRRYELNSGGTRRGSAGDALNLPSVPPIPSIYREASEPLLAQHSRQPSAMSRRQPVPQAPVPLRQPPPPLQTSSQPQHYYSSMLSPEQQPPAHRDSPNYRAMPTRRPIPGRSPSRGRRVGLQETYAAGAMTTMVGEHRRGPGSARGSVRGGSQRGAGSRRMSRAERSARINVSEARRKKRERLAGEEGKGGVNCVIC